MSGDSQSASLIYAHYASNVNIEHFLCPITANKKLFRQEESESEGESEAGGDASSQMTTIRRFELCSQSP